MNLVRDCLALAAFITVAVGLGIPFMHESRDFRGRTLQDVVTFDGNSMFVRGERLFLLSGDSHPFRLPVPSSWIDNFQKIKALGFNAVSFYTYWPLLVGKPGEFSADGVFALEQWFQAAKEAGIYLIARPGPYIHSESSGGGLPGWIQRVKGTLRTRDGDYLLATRNYLSNIARIIAKAQVTEGGPVILVQAENEYSYFDGNQTGPDGGYMQSIIETLRSEGVVVPITNNNHEPLGYNAPGTGAGAIDIYGYDSYPIGIGCWNLYDWPTGGLKTDYWKTHMTTSANTPHAIMEFQGGAGGSWKDNSYDICSQSVNEVFERIVYKNNYASAAKIMNIYPVTGGTNWGNIGYPLFYTSYDVGAMIREDRTLNREKYAEMKLQGQFFKVTPAYLDASPISAGTSSFTNDTSLFVTQLGSSTSATKLYVLRHDSYESENVTPYKLEVQTSRGRLNIPYFDNHLTLNGRDSKIHVTDYDVDGVNLLYSSAEIFTWKKYDDKIVLILYGGPNERHEAAISSDSPLKVLEGGQDLKTLASDGTVRFNWPVSTTQRTVLRIGDVQIYLLDRNSAYQYFVPLLPSSERGAYGTAETNPDAVVVKAGYLVRTANIDGSTLQLFADFNTTTEVEVIGFPKAISTISVNGVSMKTVRTKIGTFKTNVVYAKPTFDIPDLDNIIWKFADGLPEISNHYDDSKWRTADNTVSNNQFVKQNTPTVLWGSEYGFHPGYLLFRGHFFASGKEKSFRIHTAGGYAFGSSVWLNNTYLGSWAGDTDIPDKDSTYQLPFSIDSGKPYVLTVVVDNNGRDMNFAVGVDSMKAPRGILDYDLNGTKIDWKITGNLGGEDYQDRVRGPLNEGGSYPERQGWHLPNPPSAGWDNRKPTEGLQKPGIGFFTTEFDLHVPKGWEVPIDVLFTKTSNTRKFRVQLFVNGWQFGKFNGLMGPQLAFPIPEGILNHNGKNTVAMTFWSQDESALAIEGIKLQANTPILSGRPPVDVVESPSWTKRNSAY